MKRTLLVILIFLCSACSEDKPPNIIVILADDLGYGDLQGYGASLINTPNIDKLAAEGVSLTQHYSSGNVCTPSRAGLLTGNYPIRTGLADRTVRPGDDRGIRPGDTTLAEYLKELGYKTGLVGKWHLGDKAKYHPFEHGFDEFLGILYSNDEPQQSLLDGKQAIETPIDEQNLSIKFTRASLDFIKRNKDTPFFLYLASTSPHKPLIPSDEFAGRSKAGAYGDVVEELDWGVGQIMSLLAEHGLDENTLVIFTSDNGPFPEGSTDGLLGGKGTGWEGGYRVPFIARWPGRIKAGTESMAMSMNIDILPTLIDIAGAKSLPPSEMDGKNITSLLQGGQDSPHDVLYFFNNERITALRTQRWRLMLSDYPPWRDAQPVRFEGKENLYTLMHDMLPGPAEQYDVSRDYPEEKKQLEQHLAHGRAMLESLSTQPDHTQFAVEYKK